MSTQSKHRFWLTVVVVAALFALPLYAASLADLLQPGSVEAAEEGKSGHLISVTGKGELAVEPDLAYVSMGVQTRGDTAKEAQELNAALFAKLEHALEAFKIAEKDIKTTVYQISPEYQYRDREGPLLTGYSVNHMIQVTVRDLDVLGNLLDAAGQAGVNRVNSIQFGTDKHAEYELQALELALSNAEAKAGALAKAAGRSLKGVVSIAEQGGHYTLPPMQYMERASMAMDAGASTSIMTGEIVITANVSVQYEF